MNQEKFEEVLKDLFLVGPMLEIKTKNKTHIGFVDEIGIKQEKGSILITDVRPVMGVPFRGLKIKIEDIESISLSERKESTLT